MSALLINAQGHPIADRYTELADDGLSVSAPLIVSLQRWHAEAHSLAAASNEIAVALPNTTDVVAVLNELLGRPMLVLDFPAFADGRAYSQATLLRRNGFIGVLRASGAAVVADQLLMMQRAGINEFALRADQNLALSQSALSRLRTRFYQPTVTSDQSVLALRR